MADSVVKSAARGRLLAAAIMAGVTAYLADKGVLLSDEDRAAGEVLILGGLSGLASIVTLLSKLREK